MKSLQPPPTLIEIKAIVAESTKQRFSLIHVSAAPSEDASLEPTSTLPATSSSSNILNSTLDTDSNPSNYLIRANQGHSLKLESGADDLLTPITAESGNIPQMVVHGTRRDYWGKILDSGGLKPMGRNHVHFATGVPDSIKAAFGKAKGLQKQAEAANDHVVGALPGKKNAPLIVSGMRETSTILMFLDLRKAMDKGLAFYLSENGVVLCEGDAQGIIGLELFERVADRDGKTLLEDGILVAGSASSGKAKQEREGQEAGAQKIFPKQQTLPIRDKKPEHSNRDSM